MCIVVCSSRPDHLADYQQPPVIETVLSLQFDQLKDFKLVDFRPLHDLFRERFPNIEERSPLESVFETFGPREAASVRLELHGMPPLPRVWFVNDSGSELVQFQTDRLAHNWRKGPRDEKYPRYEAIRASFRKEVETLQEWLRAARKVSSIQPTQCEVTYVNHISVGDNAASSWDLGRAISIVSPAADLPFADDFEDLRFALRFRIKNKAGEPYGRLHVRADPISGRNGEPIVGMVLTARGRPEPANLDGVFSFFDAGHERIVTAFTEMTNQEMHKRWERIK